MISSLQDTSGKKSAGDSIEHRPSGNRTDISVEMLDEHAAPGHPVSPVSDSVACEFKI